MSGSVRVAQHEPVELRAVPGRLDRFVHRAQPRHHAMRVLVVGRQQHGGAAGDRRQRAPSGSMPSASLRRNSSTKKPASADMNENATQANSSTKSASTIHSSTVTPPTLTHLVHLIAARRPSATAVPTKMKARRQASHAATGVAPVASRARSSGCTAPSPAALSGGRNRCARGAARQRGRLSQGVHR